MKKVLFLAPNYRYIRTTVTGIAKDLVKRKIPFTTNVHIYPNADKYDEGELQRLYLKTDEVEVIFNHDDPVTWSIEMLVGVNAVYGKKELVEALRDNYPSRVVSPKGSVQRYIVENNLNSNKAIIVDDVHPVKTQYIPNIKHAYFNNPMTIVIWDDGTKTMVKCQDGDLYSEETGLAVCIAKKALGNKGNFNNVFRKWCPETNAIKTSEKLDGNITPAIAAETINEYMDKLRDDILAKTRRLFK